MAAYWSRQMWGISNVMDPPKIAPTQNQRKRLSLIWKSENIFVLKEKKRKVRQVGSWGLRLWWEQVGGSGVFEWTPFPCACSICYSYPTKQRIQPQPSDQKTKPEKKTKKKFPTLALHHVTWLTPSLTWTACELASAFHVIHKFILYPSIKVLLLYFIQLDYFCHTTALYYTLRI